MIDIAAPQVWLVVAADGRKTPFLDRDAAYVAAEQTQGLVYALFVGREDVPAEAAE